MNNELALAIGEKINKAVTVLNREKQVARDYGTGFPLNHAEVHLLDTINQHQGENTSRLALRNGITKGAVAQITKKLMEKGLITAFQVPENRKEVYFELTKLGRKAVSGHDRHHRRLNAELSKYFATDYRNGADADAFFDVGRSGGFEDVQRQGAARHYYWA